MYITGFQSETKTPVVFHTSTHDIGLDHNLVLDMSCYFREIHHYMYNKEITTHSSLLLGVTSAG